MKLWILRPIGYDRPFPQWHGDVAGGAWDPWHDKAFGFVVRAGTAHDARNWVAGCAGDEGGVAWLDTDQSTCEELIQGGDMGVIIRDFASA